MYIELLIHVEIGIMIVNIDLHIYAKKDMTLDYICLHRHIANAFYCWILCLKESSLFTLKDLRDNCKTELESTNGSSSGKQ